MTSTRKPPSAAAGSWVIHRTRDWVSVAGSKVKTVSGPNGPDASTGPVVGFAASVALISTFPPVLLVRSVTVLTVVFCVRLMA